MSNVDGTTKLLGREFVPALAADVHRQSMGEITANRSFSQRLMQRCAATGLSQIDVHSHSGNGHLEFSGIDDRHERVMARYVRKHLPDTHYASIVMNQSYTRARIWVPIQNHIVARSISTLTLVEFPYRRLDVDGHSRAITTPRSTDKRVDRHVRAFGYAGQDRLRQATVVVIGPGGVGSLCIEGLVRLGIDVIHIIDPDRAAGSNLNRVLGMSYADVKTQCPKAEIAARLAHEINPGIQAAAHVIDVFDAAARDILKRADLLIVATDTHASRLFAQHVACQYLIPLVHVGVNIEVENGKLIDVSGEFAIALPGPDGWCLQCARTIDSQIAAWEIADRDLQERWVERGYVSEADVPAPSVRHLNGVVADLALGEVHNLFTGFKAFRSYVTYDQLATEIMPITIARNPSCALCSERGVLGLGDLASIPDYLRQNRELPAPPPAPRDGDDVPVLEDGGETDIDKVITQQPSQLDDAPQDEESFSG